MIENAQLIGLLGIVVWSIGVVGVMLIPQDDLLDNERELNQ